MATAFVLGMILFVACSKENESIDENLIAKSTTGLQISFADYLEKETVDLIAEELADFHGREINSFLSNPDLKSLSYDASLAYVFSRIQNDLQNDSLPESRHYLNDSSAMDFNDIKSLCDYIVFEKGSLSEFPFDEVVRNNFDLDLIDDKISQLSQILFTAVAKSKTYDEAVDDYNTTVANLLSDLGMNEYVPSKFAAAVCLNSFETWCNHYCGTNKPQEERSWWENFKGSLEDSWNTLKPYVDADLDGAAYSALYSAFKGAIYAVPAGGLGIVYGAMAGAVSGAFDGAITSSWEYHNENNRKNDDNKDNDDNKGNGDNKGQPQN